MASEVFSLCPYENCRNCWGEWCGYCTILQGEIQKRNKCKFFKPRVMNIMQEIVYLVNSGVTKEHICLEMDMADEQLRQYLNLAEDKGFITLHKVKKVDASILQEAKRLMAMGKTQKEIANRLGFAPSTVGSWRTKGWL